MSKHDMNNFINKLSSYLNSSLQHYKMQKNSRHKQILMQGTD